MNCPFSVNMFMIRAPFSRASRKMTKNDKGNSHRRSYIDAFGTSRQFAALRNWVAIGA
jgi:hypothetical protein